MNQYCVYKHTNKINGKIYIGITSRKPQYRWGVNGKGYEGQIFYNAIQKYGWDNFEHEVLADNLSKEKAEQYEIALIKQYKTLEKENGYNRSEGGSGSKGVRMVGESNPMFGKKGEEHHFYGKTHSLETRERLSISLKEYYMCNDTWNKGKTGIYTDEHRTMISERNKGNQYAKGHSVSDESRCVISDKVREAWKNEDYRKKQSESHKGQVHESICKKVRYNELIFNTIKECAEYIGVHSKTLSYWLRGKRPIPNRFKKDVIEFYV